jgi:hypothetical protein
MGIMTAVLFVVWYFNRNIPGLKSWMLSYIFGFFFCLNFLVRPHAPEVILVAAAQTCVLMMAYLCLLGCRTYVGKRPLSHRYAASAIAALVALSIYFTAVQPHTGARFLILSLGPGVFFLLSARTIAQGKVRSFPARYMVALACGGHGLFLLVRPWLFKLGATELFDAEKAFAFPQFIILESIHRHRHSGVWHLDAGQRAHHDRASASCGKRPAHQRVQPPGFPGSARQGHQHGPPGTHSAARFTDRSGPFQENQRHLGASER